MTMVALCQFKDGAVMVSDSRASYDYASKLVPNDSLQKILPIGRIKVFSYSGSVNIAERILRELRALNQRKREYQYLDGIVKKLPGLARTIFHTKSSNKERGDGLSIIVGGKTLTGDLKFWILRSPNFELVPIENDYEVMGTGSDVKKYLEADIEKIKKLPDLKSRADALLVGFNSDLAKRGIDSVGGLFQIILITKGGIQPLNYGYIDLDPEAPPESAYMHLEKGVWKQHNLVNDELTQVVHPSKLLRSPPTEKRVHDYKLPLEPREPKWHLNYFLTCKGLKIGPGSIEFYGVGTSFGSHDFPLEEEILVGLGFWGSAGEEKLELFFGQNSELEKIGEIPFDITFFPEDIDIQIKLKLSVKEPGTYFLETRVRGKPLARRVLFFDKVEAEKPKDAEAREKIKEVVVKQLRENLIKCEDPVIKSTGKAELVYFSLCEDSVDSKEATVLKNQYWVTYWNKYPLPLSAHIASAFRLPIGKQSIRVDLIDAATRKTTTITNATVESKSTCLIYPVHGKVVISIPKPGFYFVNTYVNDSLIGKSVLIAETEKPQFSYTLPQDTADEVSKGQLFILLRRSSQAKD